jgi:Mn2+/Fe2+ NRAMP family transporter
VLVLLIPVLIVNQEMVVRLGAVTGVGHARLIFERFGRFWGAFSVWDLFLLNFLTVVTEFIGVSLALSYFGVSRYVAVPIAAALLVGITVSGSFRRWERTMLGFIAASLVLLPLLLLSHPHYAQAGYHLIVPGVRGGVSSDAVLLIIAIVGTTVAPWQLFFQQSNVIDKRITPRFIGYERADTVMGSVVVVLGAIAIMMVADFAARSTGAVGHFTDALGLANLLGEHSCLLSCLLGALRNRPAGRQHHRRRRRDPGHQLHLRRRVRHQALPASQVPRRQEVLPQLHRTGGPRRGGGPDPRRTPGSDHGLMQFSFSSLVATR